MDQCNICEDELPDQSHLKRRERKYICDRCDAERYESYRKDRIADALAEHFFKRGCQFDKPSRIEEIFVDDHMRDELLPDIEERISTRVLNTYGKRSYSFEFDNALNKIRLECGVNYLDRSHIGMRCHRCGKFRMLDEFREKVERRYWTGLYVPHSSNQCNFCHFRTTIKHIDMGEESDEMLEALYLAKLLKTITNVKSRNPTKKSIRSYQRSIA